MEWVDTALHAMAEQCDKLLVNDIETLDISMEEVDVPHYERHLRIVVTRNVTQKGSDASTRHND